MGAVELQCPLANVRMVKVQSKSRPKSVKYHLFRNQRTLRCYRVPEIHDISVPDLRSIYLKSHSEPLLSRLSTQPSPSIIAVHLQTSTLALRGRARMQPFKSDVGMCKPTNSLSFASHSLIHLNFSERHQSLSLCSLRPSLTAASKRVDLLRCRAL